MSDEQNNQSSYGAGNQGAPQAPAPQGNENTNNSSQPSSNGAAPQGQVPQNQIQNQYPRPASQSNPSAGQGQPPMPLYGPQGQPGYTNDGYNNNGYNNSNNGWNNNGWNAGDAYTTVMFGQYSFRVKTTDAPEVKNGRTLATAAIICTIVSVFAGGIILDIAALVCAILGYRKLSAIAKRYPSDAEMKRAFNRYAVNAIVFAAVMLALNIIAVIYLMPMVMQMLGIDSYDQLFNGTMDMSSLSSSSSQNSTWG